MTREVEELLQAELARQKETIELIASENFVSKDVLRALGSVFVNKYSEGYIGKRFYNGNKIVDQVEELAISLAKQLFGANFVNVQPYSGSPANFAVYLALLKPGDRVLGMSLAAGGHLTHGFRASFSGKLYETESYGVGEDGFINYDEVSQIAKRFKPQMVWAGASAYSRIIDWQKFREIADDVGAFLVADISHISGLVATGVHSSPIGIADVVTSTTHKTLRGPRGAIIMSNDEEIAKKIDRAVFPGLQGGPHNNVTLAMAVAFSEALQPSFKGYAKQIVKNSRAFADEMQRLGWSVVSGGTDNHLFLVDVTTFANGLTGTIVADLLEGVGIILNKNGIPFDSRSPLDPSGIRIGTAAVTTRGMQEDDMRIIAGFITDSVKHRNDEQHLKKIASEVKEFASEYVI